MSKSIFCYLSILLFSVGITYSDEKKDHSTENEVQPKLEHHVVVTATRLETPAKELATSITVLSMEDLSRARKTMALEVLRDVMGLNVIQSGPAGGSASISIRGANSEHTLVLLDGVEMNDPITPSRSFDFSHTALSNISRIEILRGPQSTLYGSDALSGVINIITKKGQGPMQGYISALGGSFGTFSGQAGISGGTNLGHYSIASSYLQSSGFSAANSDYEGNSEKDGYKNFSLSGRVGYSPAENIELDFIFRTFQTKTEIDNFGGDYGDDPNNVQYYDAVAFKGEIRALFFNNHWEQKISFSNVRYDRDYNNLSDDLHPYDTEESKYSSNLFKIDWQHNFYLHETNTLIFGLDLNRESGEYEYHAGSVWGPVNSLFPKQTASTTGLYVQDYLRLSGRLFASLGFRLDHHSIFGDSATLRLAPAYIIQTTGTKLKTVYGTGFKSPSLYQLYALKTLWGPVGNEDLKPEKSTSWEAGFEQEILPGRLKFEAVYFSNVYDELIQFDFGQGFINVGKAEAKGAELQISALLGEDMKLFAGYTRVLARDRETGDKLLRRPEHQLWITLDYRFIRKGSLYASIVYTGKRDDTEYSGWTSRRVTLPGFTLVNATVSCDIMNKAQIFLRLDNIFNVKYETIKGYGSPGFSAHAGINMLF